MCEMASCDSLCALAYTVGFAMGAGVFLVLFLAVYGIKSALQARSGG